MCNSRQIIDCSQSFSIGLVLCVCLGGAVRAEVPASPNIPEPPKTLPQEGFFSSVKQAVNKNSDNEVVRGHFDQGDAPNSHRYFCLVDLKTGKREPNAVLGQPVAAPNGITTVKDSTVSLYSCARAEREGMLVTTGYLPAAAAATVTPPSPMAAPSAEPAPAAPVVADGSHDKIDVAGVRLGMTADEVRAVLRAKKLQGYSEATEPLGHAVTARFLNTISVTGGDTLAGEGETFDVMFTPVPGRERAMAVVHSVGYLPENAVHETVLESGLIKKYGGFPATGALPASPTWRVQGNGNVLVGDPCNGRGIFGGVIGLNAGIAPRPNVALKTTPEEFKSQIDGCGVAIVTEDHSTSNGNAPREERLIKRFTVTAYSPAIALEGATIAAQLLQAPKDSAKASARKDSLTPNL